MPVKSLDLLCNGRFDTGCNTLGLGQLSQVTFFLYCVFEEKQQHVCDYCVIWLGNVNTIQELSSQSCKIWGDFKDVCVEGGVI